MLEFQLLIDLCITNGKPQRSARTERQRRITSDNNMRFLPVLCALCGKRFLSLYKVQ